MEVFSDAVFAVAITLLALNLTITGPGHGHGHLTSQLTSHWEGFVAYLISFYTIGTVWVNHHTLLSSIAFVTRSLLFANLILLLFVVLIPAATRLLAEYLPVGGFSSRLAAAVYGVVLEGMAIGFFLILEWTLRKEGRTVPPVPPDRRWAARARFAPRVLGGLLITGTAFIHPLLALGLWAAMAGYYTFEHTPLKVKGIAPPGNANPPAG